MNRCSFSSLLRVALPFLVVGLGILLARATVRAQLGGPKLTMMTETTVYENSGTVKVNVMLTAGMDRKIWWALVTPAGRDRAE